MGGEEGCVCDYFMEGGVSVSLCVFMRRSGISWVKYVLKL